MLDNANVVRAFFLCSFAFGDILSCSNAIEQFSVIAMHADQIHLNGKDGPIPADHDRLELRMPDLVRVDHVLPHMIVLRRRV